MRSLAADNAWSRPPGSSRCVSYRSASAIRARLQSVKAPKLMSIENRQIPLTPHPGVRPTGEAQSSCPFLVVAYLRRGHFYWALRRTTGGPPLARTQATRPSRAGIRQAQLLHRPLPRRPRRNPFQTPHYNCWPTGRKTPRGIRCSIPNDRGYVTARIGVGTHVPPDVTAQQFTSLRFAPPPTPPDLRHPGRGGQG